MSPKLATDLAGEEKFWSITLRRSPHAFGHRQGAGSDGLLHLQRFNMAINKIIIKTVSMRLVQEQTLINAA